MKILKSFYLFFLIVISIDATSQVKTEIKVSTRSTANGVKIVSLPLQLPRATSAQIERLNAILTDQLSAAGNEYFGEQIVGTAVANNEWWWSGISFNEWFPVGDGRKKCLCGTLKRYRKMGLIDHGYLIYDIDHNMYLNPLSPFRYLVEQPENLTPPFDQEVEGEISLSNDLDDLNNEEMFSPEWGLISQNISQPICIYGTWIVDDNRLMKEGTEKEDGEFELTQRHVEIHPVEQLWFKNRSRTLYLCNIADYSERYNTDDEDNFDKSLGNLAKPWAETPLQGNFALPFICKLNGSILNYSIFTTHAHNMFQKATEGKVHELTYNGKTLVRVAENPGTFEDFVSVSFDSIYTRPDGSIQGYIILKTVVGKKDVNGGTITLAVTKNETLQPGFYALNVKSIKRLNNNSFRCNRSDGQQVSWPENTSGYDETSASFTISTSGATVNKQFSIVTGQTLSTPAFQIVGRKLKTDDKLAFTIVSKDKEENLLGNTTILLRNLPTTMGIEQKAQLVLLTDCIQPVYKAKMKSPSGEHRPPTQAYRLIKFEINYTIQLANEASINDQRTK